MKMQIHSSGCRSLCLLARVIMVTVLFAGAMPEPARASDWEAYGIVCEGPSGSTITTARDGKEVEEKVRGGLVALVNKMMDDGWQPLGSPTTSPLVGACQAMVHADAVAARTDADQSGSAGGDDGAEEREPQ